MKFEELELNPDIKSYIQKNNFVDCTEIQEKAFSPILKGNDLSGLAQTGTGKTAAYLIPLMERIYRSEQNAEDVETKFADWRVNNIVLIIVPTRELAQQVTDSVLLLGQTCVAVYGGQPIEAQAKKIKEGVRFIVATPGRLIDLQKNNIIDLNQVRAVVFDEADRMFDMGFKPDMLYVLQRIPKSRQFLVFSATLNLEVLTTAYEFGAQLTEIEVSKDQLTAEGVKDYLFHIGEEEKHKYVISLIEKTKAKQIIIFCNYKNDIERLCDFLNNNGYSAEGLSSLASQGQRNRIIAKYKEGNLKLLVGTDLAARGLDIKGVDLVINFNMPEDQSVYVHRIGRTGRAGREGNAYSLVTDRDVEALARIEEYLDRKIEITWLEDEELVENFKKPANYVRSVANLRQKHKSFNKKNQQGTKSRPYKKPGDRKPYQGKKTDGENSESRPRKTSDTRPKRDSNNKYNKPNTGKTESAKPYIRKSKAKKGSRTRSSGGATKATAKKTGLKGLISKIFG